MWDNGMKLAESQEARDKRMILEWQKALPGFQRDQLLQQIVNNLGGIIAQATMQYRTANIPQATMELEARRLAVEALKDWKPSQGMKPSSFVGTRVRQRLYRWVNEHRSSARIPEEHVRHAKAFQQSTEDLAERFGRAPTTHELADHMGISVAQVSKLRKLLRTETFNEFAGQSIQQLESEVHRDPNYQRAIMGYYSLTPQEQAVFDRMLGAHGHHIMKPREIAQDLKISDARVSTLRKSIGTKLERYMQP